MAIILAMQFVRNRTGVVFYGSVRDVEGLEDINGFNGWIKGSDPSIFNR
jgi:hypothetical protein